MIYAFLLIAGGIAIAIVIALNVNPVAAFGGGCLAALAILTAYTASPEITMIAAGFVLAFAVWRYSQKPQKPQKAQPVVEQAQFVYLYNKAFTVIDGHLNGQNMTRREFQHYMTHETRDEVTGEKVNLPVTNTPYKIPFGGNDTLVAGYSGDWRDD